MTLTPKRTGAMLIVVGLLSALLFIMAINLRHALPAAIWWQAMTNPEPDDLRQLLFHFSLLPRLTLSLLVGAGG
ncbi:MAG: hypothetical protein ACMZI0_10965 [Symbiopectobacterium sp.]|uniref:hypothetical protein n=1 Tax=Symbiopectobacterium sp. TaxID=2952789 RepID=UPI0039EA4FDC